MPTYVVKHPDGRTLNVTGPQPPSRAQLDEIFAAASKGGAAPAPPAVPRASAPSREPNTVSTLVSHVGAQINPLTAASGMATALAHPIQTVKGMGAAQGALYDKAKASYEQGDYLTAARHFADYLLPVIGPILDTAADRSQRGEVAAGAGDAIGLALSMFGPKAATNAVASRYPLASRANVIKKPILTKPDEPVQFAQREGIPLDVATASNNRFARGTQRLADESIGGSVVSDRARTAQAEGLTRVGERLAGKTGAGPTMPEQAGLAVQSGVEDAIRTLSDKADAAYGRVGVAKQATVDIAPVKQALGPLYSTLKREAELVPLQGGKARALTALDRIMTGPDRVSLATADAATGDLGALAGQVALTRTPGQGAAAKAFATLRTAVNQTAAKAGPDVLKALEEGRAATKTKWQAIDVLESIADEPVQAFNRATWANDAGIAKLRDVAKLAPDAMPQVGRAWLDALLNTATEHGGFAHAQKLASAWDKMGPETKALLFKDPAYIKDLGNFFQIAKRLAENPNPSGTALTLWKGGELTGLVTAPAVGVPFSLGMTGLSRLMHSPAAVKLVTQGLTLPATNLTAAKMWAARAVPVFNAVQRQGAGSAPMTAPAMAETGATR